MTSTTHPASQLLRRDALEQCFYLDRSSFRILSVHAQAGAGKTTLISQYEEATDSPFAWVTCTPLHADPLILFENIVESLNKACPVLQGEDMLHTLHQSLAPEELIDLASHCLKTSLETVDTPLTLVLDDAHLLQDHLPALRLIRRIYDATPGNLRLIIASRFPLRIDGEPLFVANQRLVVDESILNLSREEIASLYNGVLGIPVDAKGINTLYETTQGWIAGLILLRNDMNPAKLHSPANVQAIGRYFDELATPLPSEIQRELLLTALLTDIPGTILDTVSSSRLRKWLADMATQRLFIRSNSEQDSITFRLHHLYQEHLIRQCEATIPAQERDVFLKRCGRAMLVAGAVEAGINYLIQAMAWEETTEALKTHGLPMIARNQHKTLLDMLDAIPVKIRMANGWLSLLHGVVLMNIQPENSYENLSLAGELFKNGGEPTGELIATAFLINCDVSIFGRFGRKARWVHSAVRLFKSLEKELPPALLELSAHSIALGYLYIKSNIQKASRYVELAFNSEDKIQRISFYATYNAKLLALALKGDIQGALTELSSILPLSNDKRVGPTTRYTIDIHQANFLLMAGDIIGYRAMRDHIHKKWDSFMGTFFTAIFITIWDLDVLTAEGKYREAYDLAERYGRLQPDIIPHMRSQILHYQMLAAAHMGRKEETLRLMRQALCMRAGVGSPYFILLTQSLAGTVLSILGETDSANRIFNKCLRLYKKHKINHDQLAHAGRAAIEIKNGHRTAAKRDIKPLLQGLQRFNNYHFFGWTPDIMKPVLCEAVKENIETDFARKLARKRLALDILDDGTPVPLLRIETAAALKLSIGENDLSEKDISPMWQRLFRLLAESPNHALNVETIQGYLWPDSPQEKSRSKFDTMLSRLRTKLGATFGKKAKRHHLHLHGQKLHLQHCIVDLDHILQNAKAGMELAKHQQYWQSHNAFVHMRHWLNAAYNRPKDWAAGQSYKDVVMRALVSWADLLIQSNDPKGALAIVEKALELEPINDAAQQQRYDLLIVLKRPGEAHQNLKRYRGTLAEEEFDPQEIDHIIENVLAH